MRKHPSEDRCLECRKLTFGEISHDAMTCKTDKAGLLLNFLTFSLPSGCCLTQTCPSRRLALCLLATSVLQWFFCKLSLNYHLSSLKLGLKLGSLFLFLACVHKCFSPVQAFLGAQVVTLVSARRQHLEERAGEVLLLKLKHVFRIVLQANLVWD